MMSSVMPSLKYPAGIVAHVGERHADADPLGSLAPAPWAGGYSSSAMLHHFQPGASRSPFQP
jgi:hypothetical protein